MPLHDWTNDEWWENFHGYWIYTLAEAIHPLLPEGYRVYVESYSRVGLALAARPDVGVAAPIRSVPPGDAPEGEVPAPDDEVAVGTIEPWRAIYVQHRGLMVAAVEIVSPRNKDRVSGRAESVARYAGYLRGGIHLMLIDLLPHPAGFSFADAVAAELDLPNQPPVAPPAVVSYRVGEPAAVRGSLVAVWRRPLVIGQSLPVMPLPLTVHRTVQVDLEPPYMRAAANSYLA